jgi:hypothetical protein
MRRQHFGSLALAGSFLLGIPGFSALGNAQSPGKAQIRVGMHEGDLRGTTQQALQAAVDYAATLGGGTVSIGPGRYLMRNALTLRTGVNLVGVPGETILAACDGVESRLGADGDCNERQITIENPEGFRVGDGVSIQDAKKGGFEVTTATLTEQLDAKTFRISAPLYLDYMVSDKASARLVFPILGGWNITNVVVQGVTIEGNRAHAQPLNGCRGGGIYLFECADVVFRNCNVREFNGDGISFQVSQRVTVEDCRVENNAGLGLHPGSGSQHPIVRRNVSVRNGGDGLFVCWRVKFGQFEGNELRENRGAGISIGHKDSDNVFRQNTVTANARTGVLFRSETEAMGAHRNVFEDNVILDNGLSSDGKSINEPILIQGVHQDLQFRRNRIGFSKPPGQSRAAIATSPAARGLRTEANQLENVSQEIDSAK